MMIAMMVRSDGRNVDEPSRRSLAARVPAGSPPPVLPAVWAGPAGPPVEEMSLTAGNFSGSGNRAFDQGAASGRMDREAAEGGALCWASTDEPGYPCIAQRWTGSDDARRRPGGASRTVLLPEPLSGRRWKLRGSTPLLPGALIRRPRMRRTRPEPAPACVRVKKSGDRAVGVAGAA